MDELKPQRRAFQFSLRKLMLWMMVWAAYLAVLRVLWLPAAILLTVWVFGLAAVRIEMRFARGWWIAAFGTTSLSFFMTLPLTLEYHPVPFLVLTTGAGFVLGVVGLLVVCGVVNALDWIDNWMGRTRGPPKN